MIFMRDVIAGIIGILVVAVILKACIINVNATKEAEVIIGTRLEELQKEYKNGLLQKEELDKQVLTLRQKTQLIQLKVDVVKEYFKSLGSVGKLTGTESDWVFYSEKNGLDYKRPIAISLHETYENGYGNSVAIHKQKNVAGINLTWEERKIMNVNGYIANLKTYQNLEESIMATCRKLKDYKEWYGAETLTEIKQKYCPDSDERSSHNGGSHGNNTIWLPKTLKYYYGMEVIEKRLLEERGLIME
jgi:hypothetical protein